VRGGIFPTHFFGQKHPSFFDHFKRRSANTKHTFGNNKDVTLEWGGQFTKANSRTSALPFFGLFIL
jgi:hypothetical protein